FEKEIAAIAVLDSDDRDEIAFRLGLLTQDDDALWRELEAICEEGKSTFNFNDFRWHEAEYIVKELGRRSNRDTDRMMKLLEQKTKGLENNPLVWMKPLVILLAGFWKHAPAIPLLVAEL